MGNISLPPTARYLVWFVMGNHYHVILHVGANTAKNWDQNEAIKRWRKLFGGGVLRRYRKPINR
jgi:hypothetical protein